MRVALQRGMLYLLAGLIVLTVVFPMYWMVNTTLLSKRALFEYPPHLWPPVVVTDAYRAVFGIPDLLRWSLNSILVAGGTVLFTLAVSVPAAYALARSRARGHKVIMFAILMVPMLPPTLIIVPLYKIFLTLRLIDTYTVLVLSLSIFTMPVAAWILKGFFEKVPVEIEEAAALDGCSRYSIFLRIALPVAGPAIFTVSILTFFQAWNEFVFAFTFVLSREKWVGTVGLASFIGQYLTDERLAMAYALFFSIFPVGLYLGLRRYIVSGIGEAL